MPAAQHGHPPPVTAQEQWGRAGLLCRAQPALIEIQTGANEACNQIRSRNPEGGCWAGWEYRQRGRRERWQNIWSLHQRLVFQSRAEPLSGWKNMHRVTLATKKENRNRTHLTAPRSCCTTLSEKPSGSLQQTGTTQISHCHDIAE